MVTLRKRKVAEPSTSANGLQKLLDVAAHCKRLLIFTGSGLSATSGMSTFSTRGGLYERAQKRFAVQDGKKLFTYAFFEKQRLEAMAFFADIYAEAKRAKPSAGHRALAGLAAQGKLQRHYTLNIDGLAQAVGLSTWHPDDNPTGQTLEMHGSIREMVCPECGHVTDLTAQALRAVRAKQALPCTKCHEANLRMRIMLYDDGEADVITPDDVFDVLEEDVRDADMILWVGISFQQSASTAYFRRVRGYLQESGRLDTCKQAVINLSEDCLWNLLSSCSNVDNLNVLEVLASADEAMEALALRLADAPASSSAPAVLTHASAPAEVHGAAEPEEAPCLHHSSAPAAALHGREGCPAVSLMSQAAIEEGNAAALLEAQKDPASAELPISQPAALAGSAAALHSRSEPALVELPNAQPAAFGGSAAAPHSRAEPASAGLPNSQPATAEETHVQAGAEASRAAAALTVPCSAEVGRTHPRQDATPAGAPGPSLGTRPLSSAALSESPAALAMPSSEEQLPGSVDR